MQILYKSHFKKPLILYSYGRGKEVEMTFGDFVDLINKGDDKHYLTTQEMARDSDGRPDVMGTPLLSVRDDFSLRPALMGNLVPFNVNLWAGNAPDGSRSGVG